MDFNIIYKWVLYHFVNSEMQPKMYAQKRGDADKSIIVFITSVEPFRISSRIEFYL